MEREKLKKIPKTKKIEVKVDALEQFCYWLSDRIYKIEKSHKETIKDKGTTTATNNPKIEPRGKEGKIVASET